MAREGECAEEGVTELEEMTLGEKGEREKVGEEDKVGDCEEDTEVDLVRVKEEVAEGEREEEGVSEAFDGDGEREGKKDRV